jgi:antitoxin component YwqK of YwqJK toxin-antitoxin module
MSSTDSFGELNEICNYIDGKINGEYKSYHYNGCELSDDSDNSKHKNLSSTDSFGELNEICNYIDGKTNGEFKSYHYNGKLNKICNLIDGQINGEAKVYHKNGNLFVICNYNYGKRIGEYKNYYESGELNIKIKYYISYQYSYSDNVEYWKNGNVKETFTHIDRNIDGERKYYNSDGQLYNVEYYVYGKKINKYVSKFLSIIPVFIRSKLVYFL